MKSLLLISLGLGLALQFFYYPNLPATVGSTFDFAGEPVAWISKEESRLIGVMAYLVNSLAFLSVPLLFRVLPTKWISFPNRDHWLAGERRSQSIPVMCDWLYFFGLLTNVFIAIACHLVYQANRADPVLLDTSLFFTAIAIYCLALAAWIIALYRRFRTG